jgi:hypothetical protein
MISLLRFPSFSQLYVTEIYFVNVFNEMATFKRSDSKKSNWILKIIKSRLNSKNTCYHSVQNFLFSLSLSQILKAGV